jgi:hypothetical protein
MSTATLGEKSLKKTRRKIVNWRAQPQRKPLRKHDEGKIAQNNTTKKCEAPRPEENEKSPKKTQKKM